MPGCDPAGLSQIGRAINSTSSIRGGSLMSKFSDQIRSMSRFQAISYKPEDFAGTMRIEPHGAVLAYQPKMHPVICGVMRDLAIRAYEREGEAAFRGVDRAQATAHEVGHAICAAALSRRVRRVAVVELPGRGSYAGGVESSDPEGPLAPAPDTSAWHLNVAGVLGAGTMGELVFTDATPAGASSLAERAVTHWIVDHAAEVSDWPKGLMWVALTLTVQQVLLRNRPAAERLQRVLARKGECKGAELRSALSGIEPVNFTTMLEEVAAAAVAVAEEDAPIADAL